MNVPIYLHIYVCVHTATLHFRGSATVSSTFKSFYCFSTIFIATTLVHMYIRIYINICIPPYVLKYLQFSFKTLYLLHCHVANSLCIHSFIHSFSHSAVQVLLDSDASHCCMTLRMKAAVVNNNNNKQQLNIYYSLCIRWWGVKIVFFFLVYNFFFFEKCKQVQHFFAERQQVTQLNNEKGINRILYHSKKL